jgi:uncharacterized protein YacL
VNKSVFVESVRLLIVVVMASFGYGFGLAYNAAFVGSFFWGCIGYVVGGVLGRYLRSATERVEEETADLSAGELVAGAVGGLLLGLLGALVASPAILFLPAHSAGPLFCLIVWIAVNAGFRIARAKSPELLAMVHLSDRSQKETRSEAVRDAVLLDSSALVDSRILRVSRSGFLHRNLLVPEFILEEVRGLADSQDTSTRRKARWALESMEAVQRDGILNVVVLEERVPELEDVDAKLVALATRLGVPLLSNDEPLSRIAELRGVRCLSLHRLARSLSSVLVPGERLALSIVKEGQEPGEGVGFLDEGSMVVVSNAASMVGEEIDVTVTSSARTPRGRIFFAAVAEA